LLDEARHADNGSVRAMRGAKASQTTRRRTSGKRLERLRRFFPLRDGSGRFKNEYFSVAQGFALAFGAGADTIERESYGLAEKLFELFRGRLQGIFRIGPPLGRPRCEAREAAAF